MDFRCTDPAILDAITFGGTILLVILIGVFGALVVNLRGWLALVPLSFPHIYALLGTVPVLYTLHGVLTDNFPNGAGDVLGATVYLTLFALAVRWGAKRFGFSWGILAMQLIQLGITLLVIVVLVNTPDSSEVTWPNCDGTSLG
jgi:hypothetical protein